MSIQQFINKVICGDCLEVMKQIPDSTIDLIIADPPYYTTQWIKREYWGEQVAELAGIKNIARFEAEWDKFKNEEEYQEFTNEWIKEAFRVLRPKGTIFVHGILSGEWTGLPNVIKSLKDSNFKMLNMINWCKPNGQPNLAGVRFSFSTEQILWAGKEGEGKRTFNYQKLKEMNNGVQMRDFWLIPTEPSMYEHPCPKPIKLIKTMVIACSKENDIILDPFLGSGTTAVVSKMLNRKFIGIEKEQKYVEIANARLKPLFEQKRLGE